MKDTTDSVELITQIASEYLHTYKAMIEVTNYTGACFRWKSKFKAFYVLALRRASHFESLHWNQAGVTYRDVWASCHAELNLNSGSVKSAIFIGLHSGFSLHDEHKPCR